MDHDRAAREAAPAGGPSSSEAPDHRPAAMSARQRELLGTSRWQWLGPFLNRWFACPLQTSDGSAPEQIAVAAERVGVELPGALVEWFELVGSRLESGQDSPATPSALRVCDGRPVVWTENQGVWSIVAGADGDDPVCVLDDPAAAGPWAGAPVSATVCAMLISDTLVGLWSDSGHGPLGRLAASVHGGAIIDITPGEAERLLTAYPALPLPANPFWATPARGDGDTLLRGDADSGMGIEWATATPAAYDRLAGLVDLDPPGGEHELLLLMEQPGWAARRFLLHPDGSLRLEPFRAALAGGLGHLGGAGGHYGRGLEYSITTTRPAEAAAALLALLPRRLRRKVTLKERPARMADYRTLQTGNRRNQPTHA